MGAPSVLTVDCPMCLTLNPSNEPVCQECGATLPASRIPVSEPEIVYSVLLGCTRGTSNKQYLVTVEKKNKEFMVFVQWGPRGKLGRLFLKGTGNDLRFAKVNAENLVANKLAKGYVVESRSL